MLLILQRKFSFSYPILGGRLSQNPNDGISSFALINYEIIALQLSIYTTFFVHYYTLLVLYENA